MEIDGPREPSVETLREIWERLAALARYTDEPIAHVRLTLRHPDTRVARMHWVADASLRRNGRLLAAHATGKDARRRSRRSPTVSDAGCAGWRTRAWRSATSRAIEKGLAGLAHDDAPARGRCWSRRSCVTR